MLAQPCRVLYRPRSPWTPASTTELSQDPLLQGTSARSINSAGAPATSRRSRSSTHELHNSLVRKKHPSACLLGKGGHGAAQLGECPSRSPAVCSSCGLPVQPSALSLSLSPEPGTATAARAQHRLGPSSPRAAAATEPGWMFQASWSCWLPVAQHPWPVARPQQLPRCLLPPPSAWTTAPRGAAALCNAQPWLAPSPCVHRPTLGRRWEPRSQRRRAAMGTPQHFGWHPG